MRYIVEEKPANELVLIIINKLNWSDLIRITILHLLAFYAWLLNYKHHKLTKYRPLAYLTDNYKLSVINIKNYWWDNGIDRIMQNIIFNLLFSYPLNPVIPSKYSSLTLIPDCGLTALGPFVVLLNYFYSLSSIRKDTLIKWP